MRVEASVRFVGDAQLVEHMRHATRVAERRAAARLRAVAAAASAGPSAPPRARASTRSAGRAPLWPVRAAVQRRGERGRRPRHWPRARGLISHHGNVPPRPASAALATLYSGERPVSPQSRCSLASRRFSPVERRAGRYSRVIIPNWRLRAS